MIGHPRSSPSFPYTTSSDLRRAVGAGSRTGARLQRPWPRRAAGGARETDGRRPRRLPATGRTVKITRIHTLRLEEFPSLVHVLVHTDDGLVGLGEKFFFADAVEAHTHAVAGYLLGQDPRKVERHWRALHGYVGTAASGAAMRTASAIDIALWDICGQATDQPLHRILGGACRDSIRTYNTCAGYRYIRDESGQAVMNWGLPGGDGRRPVRGSRRVPRPSGRPGPRPPRPGHHRHEDLAVRPVRRSESRARHQHCRARSRARAVQEDPGGSRSGDRHHG